jgi:dihydroneopterin aldolase
MTLEGGCSIFVEGIRVFAHHGVLPEEKTLGQEFVIDVELELSGVPGTDELSSTVDYALVAQGVAEAAVRNRYDLIETLAAQIASGLLEEHGGVATASVTVRKPEAPMPVPVSLVAARVVLKRPRGGDDRS